MSGILHCNNLITLVLIRRQSCSFFFVCVCVSDSHIDLWPIILTAFEQDYSNFFFSMCVYVCFHSRVILAMRQILQKNIISSKGRKLQFERSCYSESVGASCANTHKHRSDRMFGLKNSQNDFNMSLK